MLGNHLPRHCGIATFTTDLADALGGAHLECSVVAMTVASAHAGYTQGFWILLIGGIALFLVAPLIQRLMHGVK